MKRRTPILVLAVAAVVALVVAVSGGSAKKAPPSAGAPPSSALSIKSTSVGKVLADGAGRTLYLFQGDKPNVSRLSAPGRAVWPPFTASVKPRAGGGASAMMIGTTGRSQVTYNGHPLYHYVGDHNAGDTNGQGLNQFGALWYVVGSSGNANTASASSNTPSAGGYGY
jgi:predicted lipoprotein with Yx(FWY)xxD motif